MDLQQILNWTDSKRDGENIFNIMKGVAITVLVKRVHNGHAKIFYRDIGDYLSLEHLDLEKVSNFTA